MEQILPIFIPPDRDQIAMHPPTPSQMAQVRTMTTLGVRPIVMAILFDVSLCDLAQTCGPEIKTGVEAINKAILANLKQMALSKRHLSATLFWIKTFCSHLLPAPKNKPYEWNPNDPNDRVQFTVYNNDGEPNHDY